MSYSDFTLPELKKRFQLTTDEATDLFAICIQHELDHLNGKLFLDRMTDLSTLTQLDEFDRYWKKEHAAVI